jgi:hypothetical protein
VEIKCQLDATDLLHLVGILFPHIIDDTRSKPHQTYQLLYIYSIPPDDELQICTKHEEVD